MHNKKLRDLKNQLRFLIVDSCIICYNDVCFIIGDFYERNWHDGDVQKRP